MGGGGGGTGMGYVAGSDESEAREVRAGGVLPSARCVGVKVRARGFISSGERGLLSGGGAAAGVGAGDAGGLQSSSELLEDSAAAAFAPMPPRANKALS